MDYHVAKRTIVVKRAVGALVAVVAVIFAIAGLLLYVYSATRNGGALFSHLYHAIQSLVVVIYGHTQVLMPVWQHAPIPDPQNILASGSIKFFICYAFVFIGMSLVASGNKLARRLARIDEEIQDDLMRASVCRTPARSRTELQQGTKVSSQPIWKEVHTLYIAPLVVGIILLLMAKL